MTEDPLAGRPQMILNALMDKARTLSEQGRTQDEVHVYDEVLSRFGDSTDPEERESAAWAGAKKCWSLYEASRFEDVLAAAEDVRARFDGATELGVRVHLAVALAHKSYALGELHRWEEAIAVDDEIVSRLALTNDTDLRRLVVTALSRKTRWLELLGESNAALDLARGTVAQFGSETESSIKLALFPLRKELARMLFLTGRQDELAEELKALLVHAEEAGGAEALHDIASAVLAGAKRLIANRQLDDALSLLDESIARFSVIPSGGISGTMATALNLKVVVLEQLTRSEEAANTFGEMVDKYGDDALAMFDGTVERLADASEPERRREVTAALVGKVAVLEGLHRDDEALAVLGDLISRLHDCEDREVLAAVRNSRDNILRRRNQHGAPGGGELTL